MYILFNKGNNVLQRQTLITVWASLLPADEFSVLVKRTKQQKWRRNLILSGIQNFVLPKKTLKGKTKYSMNARRKYWTKKY